MDIRDYSHDKYFGTLGASQLPTKDFTIYDSFSYTIVRGDTLSGIASKFKCSIQSLQVLNNIVDINKIKVGQVIVIPARDIKILNQTDLDFCTAYEASGAQKAIWGIDFDPYYQFAKTKQIEGEYTQYGANLRDAAQSLVKYGSLPFMNAPYTHNTGSPNDKPRDFLANWANYPIALDSIASKEKDLSYFAIDGSYDYFDNIRSTLYMHLTERRIVSLGLFWHDEWTEAVGGIIPPTMPTTWNGGGHDISVIGQKTINGFLYLVLQNSWGDTAGDKGFYYFPRQIIDQIAQLGYGSYTFSRIDSSGLKTLNNWLTSLLALFFNRYA